MDRYLLGIESAGSRWLAPVCALALLALGILISWRWTGNAAPALAWALATVAGYFLLCIAPSTEHWRSELRAIVTSPWLWLFLAVACSAGVFVVGTADHGALRHYGEVMQIRSGLWTLVAIISALALLAEREAAGWPLQIAAMVAVFASFTLLLLQPDLYSAGLLLVVANVSVWRARNALRYWLPIASVAMVATGIVQLLLGASYRLERLWSLLLPAAADPQGAGWEAQVFAQSRVQAGWAGAASAPDHSALQQLPIHTDWYMPGYIDAWGGLLAQGAILLLLLAIGVVMLQRARQARGARRRMLNAGLSACTFVVAVSFLAYNFGILPTGSSYGLPFAAAGQFSVAAALLLALGFRRGEEDAE